MFDILTRVRQGGILSPFLFLIVIDFLMRKTVDGHDYGITWGTGELADLDFADDIALISDSPMALRNMTTELQNNAAKVDLRSVQKRPRQWQLETHKLYLSALITKI